MTSSISPIGIVPSARPMPSRTPVMSPALREATVDLGQALKAGDVAAARTAYGAMAKAAPAGAAPGAGSPFALMGRALVAGDVAAAKTAYGDMVRGRLPGGVPVELPAPLPLPPVMEQGHPSTSLHLVA